MLPAFKLMKIKRINSHRCCFESRVGFDRLMESPGTAQTHKFATDLRIVRPCRDWGNWFRFIIRHQTPKLLETAQIPLPCSAIFYGLLQWLVGFERACSELLERERIGERPIDEEILPLHLLTMMAAGLRPTAYGNSSQFSVNFTLI